MSELERAILCVDDEALILMNLKMLLQKRYGSQYRYEFSINPKSALEILESMIADGIRVILIISDWLMPEMNGGDLLRIVQQRHPNIHAVIISGQIDTEVLKRLKEERLFSGFLSKPFSSADFYSLIDNLVKEA